MTVSLISSALLRRAVSSNSVTGIRQFSQSAAQDASWGFIGLGAMGWLLFDAHGEDGY
jgi:hypothetical protein